MAKWLQRRGFYTITEDVVVAVPDTEIPASDEMTTIPEDASPHFELFGT